LKLWIKKFENLFANKLVITINDHKNLIGLTKLMGSSVDIGYCHCSLLIDNDFHLFFRYLMILNILFYFLCSAIIWGIINVNDVIIWVLLLEDGIKVMFVSFFFNVVKTWYDNTKRLFFIERYLIFCLVIISFLICQIRGYWLVFQCLKFLSKFYFLVICFILLDTKGFIFTEYCHIVYIFKAG
jgi:hypothetical protein